MNWKHNAIFFASMFIFGCAPTMVTPTGTGPTPKPTLSTKFPTEIPTAGFNVRQYTTQNDLTGNRFINGSMDLQNASIIDIPLDGMPIWLVSAPINDDIVFVAVMENGIVQAFKVSGQTYEPFVISPSQLSTEMPPLLVIIDGNPQLTVSLEDASPLTNPLFVNDKLAYITNNGDLVLGDLRLPINALPDARILMDEKGRLLVLNQPTDRYAHGVLGDDLEASGVAIIETSPEFRVVETVTIDEPDVIEGISPIWTDMNNDGKRDIILTLSISQSGARIVAFSEDGVLLAETPSIGNGYRWRHQIAVAQFEANKPPLLVSVRTPHIGGIVEFFQYENGKLDSVMEFKGFSTHSIGSRNLDSGIAGDFNNDGVVELLVPDQSHENLGIISINDVIATLPLNGTLTSNLSATALDGKIFVGAGTQGNLRIWIP